MRVAFDCTPFRRGVGGGYEEYLFNLLDGLAALNLDDLNVDLWVLDSQRHHFVAYEERFRLRTMRDGGLWWRVLWQNTVLPWLSRGYAAMVFTGNVRPWILACPSITVIHDLQYLRFPELWPRSRLWHRHLFVSRSVRHSTAVVTLTNTVAAEIEADFGRRDLVVCGQAIRIEHKDPVSEVAPDVPAPYLLVPSALAEHKNLANLCSAIRRVAAELQLPTFVFIGAYRAVEFPYDLPAGYARVLGYVSTVERDRLLAGCDGLVLPSIYEGFGMPYAEALLAGKSVIASDLPVSREVLGSTATFIAAPHGVAEIESALRRWVAGGRVAVTSAAQAELRQRTDPVEVARRYLAVIRDVIRE
ncbi:MAG: glycosyltransferase family 4 protein [bacterium]|nr:glycosyltransferase family 4 protein [bacterium]